jgi:hypothetical protein
MWEGRPLELRPAAPQTGAQRPQLRVGVRFAQSAAIRTPFPSLKRNADDS